MLKSIRFKFYFIELLLLFILTNSVQSINGKSQSIKISQNNNLNLKKEKFLNYNEGISHNPQNQHTQNNFFILASLIQSLMIKYKISDKFQYKNCLNSKQSSVLDKFILTFLNQLSQKLSFLNQIYLSSFDLHVLIQQISSSNNYFIQKNSNFNCLLSSNDIKYLLFTKYNVKNLEQFNQSLFKQKLISYLTIKENLDNLRQSLQKIIQSWRVLESQSQMQISNFSQILSKEVDSILIETIRPLMASQQENVWGITVIDPHIAPYKYYGISNSNGLIGVVSDKTPFKLQHTVLAGVYDKYTDDVVDKIVQDILMMDMEIVADGVKFGKFESWNYVQYIDFKKAQFQGRYSIEQKVSVQYKYATLRNQPHILHLQVQINAHKDINNLVIRNFHSPPAYFSNVKKQFQTVRNKYNLHIISTTAKTPSNKIDVVLSSTFLIDPQSQQSINHIIYGHQVNSTSSHTHTLEEISLKKGQKFKFYLVSALISSQHHSDPKSQAIRRIQSISFIPPLQLKNKHYQLWQNLWSNGDVIIQGNNKDQLLIRSMIYHLHSFTNQFVTYGLAPMGLSTSYYRGHIFWDMDLWMFPSILILNPKVAKSMIQYRYDRIKTAKYNSFINGYRGTMFPWQGSKPGDQQCPYNFPAAFQIHNTGVVALATWRYFCVTKDKQWLKQIGKQIIEGVAEFWQSKVTQSQDNLFHIHNVVAPDQYAQFVDDDAFTNAIAKESFRIANSMYKVLEMKQNQLWRKIYQNLVVLKFSQTNITKQHSTYNGQTIKQADVNLLAYPLKQVIQKQRILKDLQYYIPKVGILDTPSMSHSIFALLYSRVGESEKSYRMFLESFQLNLLLPFNVMSQNKFGNNPYFLTGVGGIIQCVINGYGGIDITDEGIVKIESALPKSWKKVIVKSPFINQIENVDTSSSYKNIKSQKLKKVQQVLNELKEEIYFNQNQKKLKIQQQ